MVKPVVLPPTPIPEISMPNYSKMLFTTLTLAFLGVNCAAAQQTEQPAHTVPKLNITWDCGECQVNDKVVPLVIEAYRIEAGKHGRTVSETEAVDVKINDFRQRNPGVRVMIGIMAGKDRLGMKINYNGEEIVVKDYSANAMEGMNALCESVGKKAYKELAAKVR
jgi:hypothetical protein